MLQIYVLDWTALVNMPSWLRSRLDYAFESFEGNAYDQMYRPNLAGRIQEKRSSQSAQIKIWGNYVMANAESREHYIEKALRNLAQVLGVDGFSGDGAIAQAIHDYIRENKLDNKPNHQPYAKGTNMKENNAAAMLREDCYTVKVQFNPGEKSYTYVCNLADKPAVGDVVVVPSGSDFKFTLGNIVEVHDDVEIQPGESMTYRWVASKVDFGPYNKLLEENSQIAKVLADSYKRNAKAAFRNMVLGVNPDLAKLLEAK